MKLLITSPVVITGDGGARSFVPGLTVDVDAAIGKLQVRLQHVAARKLALAGRPAGQALSALWYLGRQQVTPATFERIAGKLPQGEFEALRSAKASMPAWMVEALRRYEDALMADLHADD